MEATFLSTAEAAELLHISQPTVRKRIREHGLETFRDPLDHRLRLLRVADVERLRSLEQLGSQPGETERSGVVSSDTVPIAEKP